MYRKLNTDKFTDYTVSQRAYCVSEDNESVVYSSMSLPVQGNQLLNFQEFGQPVIKLSAA